MRPWHVRTCSKEGQSSGLVGGSKILFRFTCRSFCACLHTFRRLSPLGFMSDIPFDL